MESALLLPCAWRGKSLSIWQTALITGPALHKQYLLIFTATGNKHYPNIKNEEADAEARLATQDRTASN